MPDHVQIAVEGRLGVITLNRPEALNALTPAMVEAIITALEQWRDDPEVRAVLFEGAGERGFCSGGDVRAVREAVLAGDLARAEAFFAAEYRMNGLIAGYGKPVVVITQGVVMGGGIGIAGHAKFRFTAAGARFAMPESAIGFCVDTGVNALLARCPTPRALLFALTGLSVPVGDALALGLTDCRFKPTRRAAVRAGIVAAAAAFDTETALVYLMQNEVREPDEPYLCLLADELADVFEYETAGDIVEAIAERAAEDPDLAEIADALASRSPLSLEVILQAQRAARSNHSLEEVLAADTRLASFMIRQPDFVEGVRAVLVDKDRRARWNPLDHEAVPRDEIAAVIAG